MVHVITLVAALYAGPPDPGVAALQPAAPTAAPSGSGGTRTHVIVGAKQEPSAPKGVRGIRVSGTALVGSGVSMAPGPTGALYNRSPVQLTLDAGFTHPDLQWLEISPAMMLEMDRSIAFGLAFRVRAFVPLRRVRPYALVGVPAFVAPITLLGAQAAFGVAVQLHTNFAIAAEFGPTIYYAGDDLTEGSVLTKLDGSAGFRVAF